MTPEVARRLFPALDQIAYLNAGTFGPLARPVVESMRAELDRELAEGRTGTPYFERTMQLRATLRERFARLVDADAKQVALTSSTTDGCNIVLGGLELSRDDEVVTTTDEHFGLLGPLGASPARVIVVPPEPDRIAAATTRRTRLLALSGVLWTDGRELPVVELRRRTGVPVLVDGAQSVGAIPVGAAGVDFLTISGQKWLCGPDATGALVVAEPERLRVAEPSYFSQAAYEPDGTFEPREGAARFERNWWPAAALAGMLAALELRPEWAYARARELAVSARASLSDRVELVTPAATRATLLSFRVDGDAAAVVERLRRRRVHVRELPGRGLVRVSIGWWNDETDLERLAAELS